MHESIWLRKYVIYIYIYIYNAAVQIACYGIIKPTLLEQIIVHRKHQGL